MGLRCEYRLHPDPNFPKIHALTCQRGLHGREPLTQRRCNGAGGGDEVEPIGVCAVVGWSCRMNAGLGISGCSGLTRVPVFQHREPARSKQGRR